MASGQLHSTEATLKWNGITQLKGTDHSWDLLTFNGAVNYDSTGLLPVYLYSIPLEDEHIDYNSTLLSPVFVPLDIDQDAYFEDRDLITAEPRIFHSIDIQRDNKYLRIYVLPLRISSSGQLEGLEEFTLSTRITPATDNLQQYKVSNFNNESVLKSGTWFKISVSETGIHKLGYEGLEELGIDPSSLDPRNIKLFGNGNGMVPEPNSMERPDDLTENAIFIEGESDGSFDPGDYILFYGQGPVQVNYSSFYQYYDQVINIYSNYTYYFLTIDQGQGKRIAMEDEPVMPVTDTVDTYDYVAWHEKDEVNLIKSGQEWYGEVFNTQTSYDIEFDIPDLVLDSSIQLKINLAARSTDESSFKIFAEGDLLLQEELASINLNSAIYARGTMPRITPFSPDDQVVNITIDYSKPNSTSVGWLNYITLNATSHLRFGGGQLAFRNASTVKDSAISLFRVQNAGGGTRIWNVTDRFNVTEIRVIPEDSDALFVVPTETLQEFIAFDGSQFLTPEFIGPLENQNLHGYSAHELLIVYPPEFKQQAERLGQFHAAADQMSVLLVTTEQIFNEFSSGSQDAGAIRDFARMIYERSERGNELRYLLLFGDGSYDYKDRLPNNTNFIPTFQSRESLKLASSYVTDDFFGCFDLNEGSNGSGNVDIGIGRLPVSTPEQAKDVVDKIIHYATNSRAVNGDWRNKIMFVADDGDNNIHLKQAEELAEIVDTVAPVYNFSKIYFDAYAQLKTPNGDRYPDVNKAIDQTVREGVLILNYTGHGGELGWGDERVLDISMINAWTNYGNMPAFVTATCEFSRFDDPAITSGGELVLLNPNGGGIGLYTTTRLAYSQSNFGLNKNFYQNAFYYDTIHQENARMGDLMMRAKNPSNSNIRNIVLLGDPALMLAYPTDSVKTLKVVNDYTFQETDTLRALSKMTISGQIMNRNGERERDFNGIIYPTVYDKPVINKTLGNDNSSRVTNFMLQNKILFKGTSSVNEGIFEFSFIVPHDISYNPDFGHVSYYAYDTLMFSDAHGKLNIVIGDSDDHAPADLEGPEIELFLNHYDFNSGDITTRSPLLLARIYDESGINTVGNGIGHDITVVIDGNYNNPVILNDFFKPVTDSYQEGTISYPLGPFNDGRHKLTLKAWDVYNNSSEATIEFIVDYTADVKLSKAYNYPNPFNKQTRFYFQHNKPGVLLDVMIHIYDLSGHWITTLEDQFMTEQLYSTPILWDGTNQDGQQVSSGMYVYRMVARDEFGSITEQVNKLMIIR